MPLVVFLVLVLAGLFSSAPVYAQTPIGVTGTWNMVFNDEFNGTSLDANKWVPCYPWAKPEEPVPGCGKTNTDPLYQAWYVPGNAVVANGMLRLTTTKVAPHATLLGKTYEYHSGMVSSGHTNYELPRNPKFTFQYGFVEMRAKLPHVNGSGASLWLLSAELDKWPPEIDIVEYPGGRANIYTAFHFLNAAGTRTSYSKTMPDPDSLYAADWHTYAVDWKNDAITWYYDGVQVAQFTNAEFVPHEPMYVLANLERSSTTWMYDSTKAAPTYPVNYDIDYIRIWQRSTGVIQNLKGDANKDNKIDGVDYSYWVKNFGNTTNSGSTYGDFNDDGKTDNLDLGIWKTAFSMMGTKATIDR